MSEARSESQVLGSEATPQGVWCWMAGCCGCGYVGRLSKEDPLKCVMSCYLNDDSRVLLDRTSRAHLKKVTRSKCNVLAVLEGYFCLLGTTVCCGMQPKTTIRNMISKGEG